MRTIDDLVRERTPRADVACFVRQEPLAAYLARADYVSASTLARAARTGDGLRASRIENDPAHRLAQAFHALVLEPARFALDYFVLDRAPDASPAELQRENLRLREENRRLLMEREILKKATAFFARESS